MSVKILFILFFSLVCNANKAKDLSAKKFNYGIPDKIITLNAFHGSGSQFWGVQLLVYDFLLKKKPGAPGHLMPALATKWSVSKDKKVYTFELNPLRFGRMAWL